MLGVTEQNGPKFEAFALIRLLFKFSRYRA